MKDTEKQKPDDSKRRSEFKGKALAFLKELGIVLGAFLVLNNFVLASFLVPTGSMENEVMAGDLLFVNKMIYGGTSPRNIPFTNIRLPWFRVPGFRDVERGDVIVFVFPGYRDEVSPEEFTFYLKRCVALSGDTLQVINRVLYVNGKPSPLPRNLVFTYHGVVPSGQIDERMFPKGAPWNEDNYGPIVIPKKGMVIHLTAGNIQAWEVFIMREGHTVFVRDGHVEIDGRPASEYTVGRDYLFGMGDHRDNSLDSRYWGFIPKESLVGSPLIVYWSWDTDIPIYNIFAKLGSVRLGRIGTLIK
jgi:signal peptidase I